MTNGRPPARSGGTETTGEVYVENVRRSNRQGGGDKGLPREVYGSRVYPALLITKATETAARAPLV